MRRLFVGTYTEPMPHVRGEAAGIHVAAVEGERIVPGAAITGVRNPSYVAVTPDGAQLYAVQETFAGDDPRLHAFALDAEGGATALGSVATRGGEPCHVSLDPRGRFVFVANYGTGNVLAFPRAANGAIVDSPSQVKHAGRGPNPRQDGPRMHAVLPDASGEHIVVCDLGTDTVAAYRLTDGGIDASEPVSRIVFPPGHGPRQLAFAPDGRHLFVVSEFAATVDSLAYDAGRLTPVDRLALLPDGWQGENLAAAVAIHPGGRFGYASNRGHDSVAVFAIDAGGRMTRRGWQQDGVAFPRDIAVDPDGGLLFVANQNLQTVTAHRIDPATGMLARTGDALPFASPSCLVFGR